MLNFRKISLALAVVVLLCPTLTTLASTSDPPIIITGGVAGDADPPIIISGGIANAAGDPPIVITGGVTKASTSDPPIIITGGVASANGQTKVASFMPVTDLLRFGGIALAFLLFLVLSNRVMTRIRTNES